MRSSARCTERTGRRVGSRDGGQAEVASGDECPRESSKVSRAIEREEVQCADAGGMLECMVGPTSVRFTCVGVALSCGA